MCERSGNSGNLDENTVNQPRQPHNLQGLLRFAMETTKGEDAPNDSHIEQMDPERRRFLEEALKSLTVDVVERLETAMKQIANLPAYSEAEQLESLEVIQSFVEDIDTANDFNKIGGFTIIHPLLNSNYENIRASGATLIAELAQNNPHCQHELVQLNVFPRLIEMLMDKEQKVACAAMHAVSCMTRGNAESLKVFKDLGGLECILGCLQTEHEKLHNKVAFLISALASEFPDIREELIELNGIQFLANTLKPITEFCIKTENILSALSILCASPVAACKLNSLDGGVESVLKSIVNNNKKSDDCREIVEHSLRILVKLRRDSDDSTDR